MAFMWWFLIAGGVFLLMALAASVLRRLPLTTAMFYLALGFVLGPGGWGLLTLDPLGHATALEHITEVAVIISLFTAGLKLRLPLFDPQWRLAVRLAFFSMVVTVGALTLVGVFLLQLPLGVAVLLGAILAPTDPVLASDVQVMHPGDEDHLRFSLTGEAGLNDGTAFPFVMLGLGLLGMHDLGPYGWRWFAIDVLWATVAGFSIGGALGIGIARSVLYLRREHQEATGLDDFLALSLIALSYGIAVLVHAYGFLAVFAAGVALRYTERQETGADAAALPTLTTPAVEEELATAPNTAPTYLTHAVLRFNEHLERVGEVVVVVLLGALLALMTVPAALVWFVPLLFLLIRPLAVWLGLLGMPLSRLQFLLTGWFGVRGIGSLYYLLYAINHGLPVATASPLIALTVTTLTASIVLHGISVTPLMQWYERHTSFATRGAASPPSSLR